MAVLRWAHAAVNPSREAYGVKQNDTRKCHLPHFGAKNRKKIKEIRENSELAEREGFEPSVEFPLHTLSKRAPSTTRPSLRLKSITYERDQANCVRPPN